MMEHGRLAHWGIRGVKPDPSPITKNINQLMDLKAEVWTSFCRSQLVNRFQPKDRKQRGPEVYPRLKDHLQAAAVGYGPDRGVGRSPMYGSQAFSLGHTEGNVVSPVHHQVPQPFVPNPCRCIVDQISACTAYIGPQGQSLHPAGVGGIGAEDEEQGEGQGGLFKRKAGRGQREEYGRKRVVEDQLQGWRERGWRRYKAQNG